MAHPEDTPRTRSELADLQTHRLRTLLARILPRNRFYAAKFAAAGLSVSDVATPDDLRRLPFTTKAELVEDQAAHPKYGTNLTFPVEEYRRYNQTSGTTGRPLRWLDTGESWQWMLGCWHKILCIVGVRPEDRLFFPFSFGPFLGFWTAFEAATQFGCLVMPGGGMSSVARLEFLLDNGVTVVLCTPTYALHLIEVAGTHGIDLRASPVWAVIVAGEPGGSIPATRARIESGWGARLFDHSGLTEVGPLTVECPAAPGGLHLLEEDYHAEIVDPATGDPVPPGAAGELVVTNFGRVGSPLLRYRTGDLVRADAQPCPCGLTYTRLGGGILGRSDELIHIRGNNVYPAALEGIIREFPEVVEFRIEVDETGPLADLRIVVEAATADAGRRLARGVQERIRDRLLFRAQVDPVPPGSLPRFEMKARRLTRKK